jgi:hypothetical protein
MLWPPQARPIVTVDSAMSVVMSGWLLTPVVDHVAEFAGRC